MSPLPGQLSQQGACQGHPNVPADSAHGESRPPQWKPHTDLGSLPPHCGSWGALVVERVISGREVGVLEEHLPAQTGPLQVRVVLVLIGFHTGEHGGSCPREGRQEHLEDRKAR